MWLQTHDPAHPLLQDLINNGFAHFARYALLERQHAALPPFAYQALFKAQSLRADHAFAFLSEVRELLAPYTGVMCIGPIPALMEKRQGQFRMQLVLQAGQRGPLQQALGQIINQVETLPLAPKVRWALDVDPQDFS
jgi:primosomal protein N' (replication factor Y)